MWEAFEHAGFHELDNLTAIIDVNRLGQTGETMHGWDLDAYAGRARGVRLEGDRDRRARRRPPSTQRSTRGDRDDRPADRDRRPDREGPRREGGGQPARQARQAPRRSRGGHRRARRHAATSTSRSPSPKSAGTPHVFPTTGDAAPAVVRAGHQGGDAQGVRRRAGGARQGARRRRRARRRGRQLAPTPRSSRPRFPERFFQVYIAEQQMVATAVGFQVRGWKPVRRDLRRLPVAAPTTSCGWRPSAARTSRWPGRTPASASARTARRRWRSRTWPRCAPSTARPCSTHPTPNQTAALVAADGRSGGHRLHAHDAREDAGPLPARRGVPHRRLPGRAPDRCDAVTLIGAGITLHEAHQGRRCAGRRGHHRAGHRPVHRQADRRRDAARGGARDRRHHHRRGPLAGGRHRRRGARRACRRAAAPVVVKLAVRDHARLRHAGRAAGRGRNRRGHIADAARELAGRAGAQGRAQPKSARRDANERDSMTGAEQDRREAAEVDQDRKAGEVTDMADRTNALHRLHAEQDQSPWIDFIDRELIDSGKLADMVADGIRGLTSNPTIFAKAVATGQYDDLIRREIEAGDGAREIYEQIAVSDVGDAADVLRIGLRRLGRRRWLRSASRSSRTWPMTATAPWPAPASCGAASTGRTCSSRSRPPRPAFRPSRRPSPTASTSTSRSCSASRSTSGWRAPTSPAFGAPRAWRGHRARRQRRAASSSAGSTRRSTPPRRARDAMRPAPLRGKAAIANAKLAYEAYGEIFGGDEFADLRAAGRTRPALPVGQHQHEKPRLPRRALRRGAHRSRTVDTMPLETIKAFLDHGAMARTLDRDLDAAHAGAPRRSRPPASRWSGSPAS